MPPWEEEELLEELRARGVEVRTVAELPFRRPERYASAVPLLVDRLRTAEDERLISFLASALRHPEFRSALPALLEKLGRVSPGTEIDVANAIRKMGVRGSEPAVLEAMARVRSWVARDALRRILRKAGYRGPEVEHDDSLSPRGRAVFLAGTLGLAALLVWSSVDLVLKGAPLVPLPALVLLYAGSSVFLGVGVWRLERWATAAYAGWAITGILCQIGAQEVLRFLPPDVFWYAEAGAALLLIIAGIWLDRILRQTRAAVEAEQAPGPGPDGSCWK